MTTRGDILAEASDLIHGERLKAYGSPETNFVRIAAGWQVIFADGVVTPAKVCLAMDWLKTCRLLQMPTARDGWVDKAGYSGLGGELSGAPAKSP
ncbi:DUF6378 domain-containing protein [Azospirillum sp. A26]|uniref:DUF6378 domain-containing protein n=1 Tax=Azospirillum sp. A26 TaxID=3160607 RepID=UPI00366BABA2